MRYVDFGKTGKKISCLGFGAMRFMPEPGAAKTSQNIDEKNAVQLLRYAYDQGVNYVDTAYIYNNGESEETVGQSLKNGYREKVYLADKMPIWLAKKPQDLDKLFAVQLKRLDTSYIDFYLLHGLNSENWEDALKFKALEWLADKKQQGFIKHIGFSFHDGYTVFKDIIDSFDWEFCQLQYNYMNETVQAGTNGVNYAHAKGIPVVVMEPLLGGTLATLRATANCFSDGSSQVETALRWLWNKPEISVVLSGMNNLQQVQDNIQYAGRSGIGTLTIPEQHALEAAQSVMKQRNAVHCTACRYCIICPMKIDIPEIFSIYNVAKNPILGKQVAEARENYDSLAVKADACIGCRACEHHCPQQLAIADKLKEAHEFLKKQPKKKQTKN
ncbi:MAG: aldo/keto reductase [Negativicutes bacterium]|jgi:hypothetical protein